MIDTADVDVLMWMNKRMLWFVLEDFVDFVQVSTQYGTRV